MEQLDATRRGSHAIWRLLRVGAELKWTDYTPCMATADNSTAGEEVAEAVQDILQGSEPGAG